MDVGGGGERSKEDDSQVSTARRNQKRNTDYKGR